MLTLTDISHHLASFLLCLEGRHVRYWIFCHFDQLQDILKTFPEWNSMFAEGIFLMLKKCHMQEIHNKVPEQSDIVLIVGIYSFAQVNLGDID